MGIQSILPEAKPMQERWMGREWKLKPIRTVNWNQLYSILLLFFKKKILMIIISDFKTAIKTQITIVLNHEKKSCNYN